MNDQAGQPSVYTLLISGAFMVWMLVDAWKRRVPPHWYFIIVVMPFGAIFYFVMIKLRNYREGTESPASTGSPRSRGNEGFARPFTTQSKPISGDIDQADALEARERYDEAEPMYRMALAADSVSKRALHGLGRCLLGQGKAKESLEHFEKLLELDREFANFGAALDYADALWGVGQKSDTVELLEALCKMTNRINHHLAHCHYLVEFGQVERAKHELEQALADATVPNAPINERHRQWIARGRQMLVELYERHPETSGDSNGPAPE